MSEIVKICLKHGELKLDQVHKENNKSKRGYLLRCNQCKLEKDRRWKELNREQHRKSASAARNESRKLYREGITDEEPKANKWIREDRLKDREKYAEYEKRHKEKIGIINYRRREVLRFYGLSFSEHDEMIKAQNNLCAICNKSETRKGRSGDITPLCIDHDHETKKVRELLCHSCNQVIGHCRESIEVLKNAILYLEKHKCS